MNHWPPSIALSFSRSLNAGSIRPESFHGSWNRLLNYIFPPGSKFEVTPKFPAVSTRETFDTSILLLVYMDNSPVLILKINPSTDTPPPSLRRVVDTQLRDCLYDIVGESKVARLYGICAFGTKFALYSYDSDRKCLDPPINISDTNPYSVDSIPPQDWWCYDIVEEEGAQKLRDVVDDVVKMCNALVE